MTRVGTVNLLLISAAGLTSCLFLVSAIVKREQSAGKSAIKTVEEEGRGRQGSDPRCFASPHTCRSIALVIAFAAIGAAIIEQQLNMAAQAFKPGRTRQTRSRFSSARSALPVARSASSSRCALTSRIHRLLGHWLRAA